MNVVGDYSKLVSILLTDGVKVGVGFEIHDFMSGWVDGATEKIWEMCSTKYAKVGTFLP